VKEEHDDVPFRTDTLANPDNDGGTFDKQSFQRNDTFKVQVNFDIPLFEGPTI
jgi:hypothetical protein